MEKAHMIYDKLCDIILFYVLSLLVCIVYELFKE